MIDYTREDVIEALEYLLSPVCTETQFDYCDEIRAAIALLKEQEPRVMTLEEVINAKDKTDVWLDEPDCVVVAATISNWVNPKNYAITFFYGIEHTAFETENYMNNNYNRTWRCWTSRPSEQQMRDTKWEGENETM